MKELFRRGLISSLPDPISDIFSVIYALLESELSDRAKRVSCLEH